MNINSSMLYTHHIQRLFILNTRLGRRPWDSAARIQEGQRIWATSEACIYQIFLAKKKGKKTWNTWRYPTTNTDSICVFNWRYDESKNDYNVYVLYKWFYVGSLKMGDPKVTMLVSILSHGHPWLWWCGVPPELRNLEMIDNEQQTKYLVSKIGQRWSHRKCVLL